MSAALPSYAVTCASPAAVPSLSPFLRPNDAAALLMVRARHSRLGEFNASIGASGRNEVGGASEP
jgi:hypothetical protein